MARTQTGEVIDFVRIRRARQTEDQVVDLVTAWQARRAQLTDEAEIVAREIGAHVAALDEAVDRFRSAGRAAIARMGQIQLQIEDINTAIAHVARRGDDGPMD